MKPLFIWTYHRVLPEAGNAAVSQTVFRQQVELLLRRDFSFIDTQGLKDYLDGKLPSDKKYAILTFDDGWADNLFYATPVLDEHSIRAVLALNTGLVNDSEINRSIDDYMIVDSKEALGNAVIEGRKDAFLTWPELEKMRDGGLWDIQAHGDSHVGFYQEENLRNPRGFYPESSHWTMARALGEQPFEGAPRVRFTSSLCAPMTKLSKDFKDKLIAAKSDQERLVLCQNHPAPVETLETQAEFEKRVLQDFEKCRETIKNHLNLTSTAFIWPWGQESDLSLEIAKKANFELLLTTSKGIVTTKTPKNSIPRLPAPANLAKFKKRITMFGNPFLRFFLRRS